MKICLYCHKKTMKLYKFYKKSYRFDRQYPKCIICIDAGEFEMAMWEEVKHE